MYLTDFITDFQFFKLASENYKCGIFVLAIHADDTLILSVSGILM